MIGNRIVATLTANGKVLPTNYASEGGNNSESVSINSNSAHIINSINMKMRPPVGKSSQNLNDNMSPDVMGNNTRIQASLMDMGKKLLQFARDNDVFGVETMVKMGSPIAADWLGMTAIHFAAINNRYDICKLLLNAGANMDTRTKVDRTPLHLAAYHGHERIVQLLIDCQCSLNSRDMLKMTPLHWAVEKGHKSVVRLLLKHHADVTAVSKFGKTPIALAVQTEQADILQELETARQTQENLIFNQHQEKETNQAVSSIMDQPQEDVEPEPKRLKIQSDEDVDLKLAIDNLENLTAMKHIDPSGEDLLKSHGICIIKDDEKDDNNLITNALESGRQLVLSEGGKMLLNQARRLGVTKILEPFKTTANPQRNGTLALAKPNNESPKPQQEVKFPTNFVPEVKTTLKKAETPDKPVTANSNDKTTKNIQYISVPEFRKLYKFNNVKTVLKVGAVPPKLTPVKMKAPDNKSAFIQRLEPIIHQNNENIVEEDDEDLPPNIIKVDCDQEDLSDIEPSPPPRTQSVESRFQPARTLFTHGSRLAITKPLSVINRTNSKIERTPVIPLLTIPEICRQLFELRKQNDDLRKKYELAEKEKEEFRNRLERLETLLIVEHTGEENDYIEI